MDASQHQTTVNNLDTGVFVIRELLRLQFSVLEFLQQLSSFLADAFHCFPLGRSLVDSTGVDGPERMEFLLTIHGLLENDCRCRPTEDDRIPGREQQKLIEGRGLY